MQEISINSGNSETPDYDNNSLGVSKRHDKYSVTKNLTQMGEETPPSIPYHAHMDDDDIGRLVFDLHQQTIDLLNRVAYERIMAAGRTQEPVTGFRWVRALLGTGCCLRDPRRDPRSIFENAAKAWNP